MSSKTTKSSDKKLLDSKMFQSALNLLDKEMSKNDFLNAFAPINIVTVGGYVAVEHFKNRMSTGDLDYIIDPEWTEDDEIKAPLKDAIQLVAKKQKLEYNWMNDELQIWASAKACKTIFERAYEQNILLFDGQSLKVWAAPLEWGLERKLRRIANSNHKTVDMDDVLVHFKHFRRANRAPLDMEYFRTLNMNGFELVPDIHHMEMVATHYRDRYNEDLFSTTTAPTSSAATYGTLNYSTTSITIANTSIRQSGTIAGESYMHGGGGSSSRGSSSTEGWSEWIWREQFGCFERYRLDHNSVPVYEYSDPQK